MFDLKKEECVSTRGGIDECVSTHILWAVQGLRPKA